MVVALDHLACGVDLDVDRCDAVFHDPSHVKPTAASADLIKRLADDLDRYAQVDQRTKHHVPRDPARAVDMKVESSEVLHALISLAILTAATAAPTPLSMFTIVIP